MTDLPAPRVTERHPPQWRAQVLRRCRGLAGLRGWGRLAGAVLPLGERGEFLVENDGLLIAGDLASFVERQSYLFGQYEAGAIARFLDCIPATRRQVVLDVGANVGTHSLAFARNFAHVHAFEPNPALWAAHGRNMALNDFGHVRLHRVGLGSAAGRLPLHVIDKENHGLGTFLSAPQYDLPLTVAAWCEVVPGDAYLEAQGIGRVDAIKIDVQGAELDVLQGLQGTIARDRPVIWFELGAGTHLQVGTVDDLRSIWPFRFRVHRVVERARFGRYETRLERAFGSLPTGDYIVTPEP